MVAMVVVDGRKDSGARLLGDVVEPEAGGFMCRFEERHE